MKASTVIVSLLSATAMVAAAPTPNPQYYQYQSNTGQAFQQTAQGLWDQYAPQWAQTAVTNFQNAGVPGFGPHPAAQLLDQGLAWAGLRRI
ncbi:hypothetical protein TWF281_010477 [Arthrobotrys megalospora]